MKLGSVIFLKKSIIMPLIIIMPISVMMQPIALLSAKSNSFMFPLLYPIVAAIAAIAANIAQAAINRFANVPIASMPRNIQTLEVF